MLCLQSFLVLGMSAICIQRHVIGNFFIQRLQKFFIPVTLYVFNVSKILFERFLTSTMVTDKQRYDPRPLRAITTTTTLGLRLWSAY